MSEENNNLENELETEKTVSSEAEEAQTEADAALVNDNDTPANGESTDYTAAQAALGEKSEKRSYKSLIIGAIVLVIVIVAAVLCKIYGGTLFNKYNRLGYINTSGRTVEDVADAAGMSIEEFLEMYNLPADMPGNTEESAAYYSIPTGTVAEMFYGIDYETFKEELEISDDFTEDSPWGETLDSIRAIVYVSGGDVDYFNEFKEYYGLGDDVDENTLWGEIRNTIDLKNKEEMEAEEQAAADAEDEALREEEQAAADSTSADDSAVTDEDAVADDASTEDAEQTSADEAAAQ